jgi:hypothetical protein
MRHTENKLSAFVNHELDPTERRLVGEHLMVCGDCRARHDEIRFGAQLAAELRQADAPIAFGDIAHGMSRGEPRRAGRFIPQLVAATLLLALVGGAVYLVRLGGSDNDPRAVVTGWSVEKLAGDLSPGRHDTLAVGGTLETGSDDRARVQVANIGNIELAPNSRVRLVETGADRHRLALDRGKLSARILAPPRLFIVDTPSAAAVDLGCAYTLEVNERGDSELHVTSGYVALEREGRDVIVPAGAMAVTKTGSGIGTPFADDASSEFRDLLYRIDFEGGGRSALTALIGKARKDDSVTLWHLLRSVPREDRETVLNALTRFVKLPSGVTRAGLLELDKEMLDAFWYQVKIVWFES